MKCVSTAQIAAEKTRLEEVKKEAALKQAADRQQTLQEMFDEDVKEFASKGALQRTNSVASSTKSIEDVEIDDTEGQKSLTDFLEDVSPLPSPPLVDGCGEDELGETEQEDATEGTVEPREDKDSKELQKDIEVKDEEEKALKQE